MSEFKVIQKGQYLFKAGDKIQSVYSIHSGQVSICLQKNNKVFDIMTVGNGYVFADWVVLGMNQYLYSAIAQQEVKVIEIPLNLFKAQYEQLHTIHKSFIKTMAERLKWSVNEVKNSKQDKNPSPCPEDAIPRGFGAIFHVLNHKGIKDGLSAQVDWLTLKNYSLRIFGESIKRVEQLTQVLVKLKLAEYEMGADPENPNSDEKTEILGFKIYNLQAIEGFFEFYQYYYYKGGKSELLKYDESNFAILKILIMAYADQQPDKFGIVSKDFNQVVDFFKDYGVTLGAGHFTALESKGLFCKRKNNSDGKVLLQFDLKEFKTQIDMWAIIREIDKLNEKGIVDFADVDDGPKKRGPVDANMTSCADCSASILLNSKFCSECGAKVVAVNIERKVA